MSTPVTSTSLADIASPDGTFAVVAMDQRNTLKRMFLVVGRENPVKDLSAGTIQALVAQQPYAIGQQGVQQAMASLQGKKTIKTIQTGFTIITKNNMNTTGRAAIYQSSC